MNKSFLAIVLLLVAALISPNPVFSETIADADALYDQGGMTNLLNAINFYERFLAQNPDIFEANWKCAHKN